MRNGLIIIIVVVLYSCVSMKNIGENVSFKIIDDKFYKDSTYVRLKINNHSKNDYFFPINYSEDSEKCYNYLASAYDKNYLYLAKIITNIKNDTMMWEETGWGCTSVEMMEKIEHLSNSCHNRIKKFVFVKSNSSTIIKVPVSLKVELFNGEYDKVENYDSIDTNNYFLSLYYHKKDLEYAPIHIDQKILDSIYKQGYKLYQNDISSNKIPIRGRAR